MFPDGSGFYLDVKDGERGYNSDPARGADTFTPFRPKCFVNTHLYSWANFIEIPNAPRKIQIVCDVKLYLFDMSTKQVFASGTNVVLTNNKTKNIKIRYTTKYEDDTADGPSWQYPVKIVLG